MPKRRLYSSENGDIWHLCSDDAVRVYVEHDANLASGGTVSQIELSTFLERGRSGPEHQALLQLIRGLIDSGS